ncbi:hypothetical protein AXX17_AT1G40190 [Arabidopsis thaliana]|uniref:Uncharacterized protein n=1 Tax=Arabidopsis thaliana TaxID=3702 RepID=A0A178WFR1_ARATH|nr:hypothetical protein AXX17_AT1G40190 [Arabidopsis thaliana]
MLVIRDACEVGSGITARWPINAFIYFIWKERNARVHTAISKSPVVIIKEINLTIRALLDPLSRAQVCSSLLSLFLGLGDGESLALLLLGF